MLFNSLEFILLFLPIALVISVRLKGNLLLAWITLISFIFYSLVGRAWFVLPMAFTIILDFILAQYIYKCTGSKKRILFLASISMNLGLLIFFKYSHFFSSGVKSSSLISLGMPAGISFYSFQTLSYIIDIYKGEFPPERNLFRFSGFVTFFPHLVAGPLTRHNQLIDGLRRIAKNGISPRYQSGISLFSIGLCKKVLLADRIGNLIDPFIQNLKILGTLNAYLVLLGFTMQIYYDFSGYSDMAIGLARLFDIDLPQNFNSPYQALNPSDFWRRWHITLSQWLRDYLYIPLGGSRTAPWRRNISIMITMIVGGIWHGANINFVFWGIWHGIILVMYHSQAELWRKAPIAIQRLTCFIFVSLGWVFFRSKDANELKQWLRGIFFLNDSPVESLKFDHLILFILICIGLFIAFRFPNASSREIKISGKKGFFMGMATGAALLFMTYSSKFLYYQF